MENITTFKSAKEAIDIIARQGSESIKRGLVSFDGEINAQKELGRLFINVNNPDLTIFEFCQLLGYEIYFDRITEINCASYVVSWKNAHLKQEGAKCTMHSMSFFKKIKILFKCYSNLKTS